MTENFDSSDDLSVTADMTCYRHPDRVTALRCHSCLNPICPDCARTSPTGYICPDCLERGRKRFETTQGRDYPIAGVVSFVLGLVGYWLMAQLPFGGIWISLIGGWLVGMAIAKVVRVVTEKRRSPKLFWTIVGSAGLGALIFALPGIWVGDWYGAIQLALFIAAAGRAIALGYGIGLRIRK